MFRQLGNGRIYEFTEARMDGYLATNIVKLRDSLEELIYKIEQAKPALLDQINKLF